MGEDRLEAFWQRRGEAGLFLDFDGTLSEVVEHADDARPLPEVPALLGALAKRLRVVAVVSGRRAEQLVEWLGPEVEIWGTHGAQRASSGRVEIVEEAAPFTDTMATVLRDARAAVDAAGVEGIAVEDKAVMVTLHYRPAADRATAARTVEQIAAALEDRYGVVASPSKAAVELRPPIELSKSTVVTRRAHELSLAAVMYVGDDVVDLAAFDALDELGREGVVTVRAAVASDEAPPELLERADVVLEGPAGVVGLLSRLAG